MNVGTTEDLQNLQNISIQTEATYLHEYIHYLQDISSTYGLMNICSIVDYVKHVNREALINNNNPEIEVPFQPLNSTDNDVKANWELKTIYLGGGKGLNDVAQINSICKCVEPVISSKGQLDVEKIVIDFTDSIGHPYKYIVGAYCVSESMAYAIENLLYPEILPKPAKMPYESVTIMSNYLLPGFSNDPLNIIALCDSCMLLFNPGVFVFDTLTEMARVGFMPNIPEAVYDFVYSNIKFIFNGHETIQQLLISNAAEAISQLGDYFTTSLFNDNRSWINYVITSAIDLRIRNRYFILNVVRKGSILTDGNVNNKLFASLLHKLGSPLVVNDDSDTTFIQPTDTPFDVRPEYMWVLNQIYTIYKSKLDHDTYKCEMIDWCNQSAKINNLDEFTDERCRYAPWERSKDSDPNPCSFGRVWKTWGLQNKFPKSVENET